MYFGQDYIELADKSATNKKTLRIRFDPILFSVVLVLGLFFVGSIVYIGITIYPMIAQMKQILTTIPGEIDFYHQVISEHNRTLNSIENAMINYLNPETSKIVNDTIFEIHFLSRSINMTQIEYDLSQIVSILQHLIRL
jgi:predicted PurR-regulated permease PerM